MTDLSTYITLSQAQEGELLPREQQILAEKIARQPELAQAWAEMTTARQLLTHPMQVQAPPGFAERLRLRIAQQEAQARLQAEQWQRWLRGLFSLTFLSILALSLTVLLAVGLFYWLLPNWGMMLWRTLLGVSIDLGGRFENAQAIYNKLLFWLIRQPASFVLLFFFPIGVFYWLQLVRPQLSSQPVLAVFRLKS